MKAQKPPQSLSLGIQPAPNIMLHMQLPQEALNHSDWIKLSAIENWYAFLEDSATDLGPKHPPASSLQPTTRPPQRLTPPVHPAALAPIQPPFQTVSYPRRRDALIPSPLTTNFAAWPPFASPLASTHGFNLDPGRPTAPRMVGSFAPAAEGRPAGAAGLAGGALLAAAGGGTGGRAPGPGLLGSLLLGSVLVSPLGLAAAQAAAETLQQSERQLSQFPFRPNCAGNNQEIVACLWQRRNQADLKLKALLRSPALLEQWRSSRRQLCAKAADKAEGGSLYPLVALGCENSLNNTLIEQISQPLEGYRLP